MPSKRYKKALEVVDGKKAYPLKEAVGVLAKFPKAKFNETIDLAFRLGVDPKQSDQMVRGTVPLPHGSGKTVRVLVFAKGNAADAAKAAGAENVGFEDMIAKCNARSDGGSPQTWQSARTARSDAESENRHRHR
jgi:large subunit ribosomal protein L1